MRILGFVIQHYEFESRSRINYGFADPEHCHYASGSAFSEILVKVIKSYHEKISKY
jgi:hypothetical protein